MGVANCGLIGPAMAALLMRTARGTLCAVDASCNCGCAKRCVVGSTLVDTVLAPAIAPVVPACDVMVCR